MRTKTPRLSLPILLFSMLLPPMAVSSSASANDAELEARGLPTAASERNYRRQTYRKLRDLDRRTQIVLSESLVLQRDLQILAERFALPEARADSSSIVTYLDAAARFLAAKDSTLRQDLPIKDNRRLADLYLAYGMHREAGALYDYLDRSDARTPAEAWMALAHTQYRRGYHGLTGSIDFSLAHIGRRAPRRVSGEKALLLGQLYIQQKRFQDADKVLKRFRGERDQEPFANFNRGVALIRGSDPEEGTSLLDKVGKLRADSPELEALKDRANLYLGLHFLSNKQGGTAVPILQRVRLDGPYSNHALLGLGWAQLSEVGDYNDNPGDVPPECELAPVASVGSLIGIMRSRSSGCEIEQRFQRQQLGKEESDRYAAALVPWQELTARDPGSAPVQEGLLAVPHAFEKLGDLRRANAAYKDAIDKLESEKRANNAALAEVNNGRLVPAALNQPIRAANDPGTEIRPAPGLDLTRLYDLFSDHPFRESLQSLRDLRALRRVVSDWERRIATLDRTVTSAVSTYATGNRLSNVESFRFSQVVKPRIRYRNSRRNPGAKPSLKLDFNFSGRGLNAPTAAQAPGKNLPFIRASETQGSLLDGVKSQHAQLKLTRAHIASAILGHEEFLGSLLKTHLEKRKQRGIVYLARAQLGRARIVEKMANKARSNGIDREGTPATTP